MSHRRGILSLFVSPHLNGGLPLPRSGQGGTQSQAQMGGVTLCQVQTGGTPISGLDGGRGTPSCWQGGIPIQDQDREGIPCHTPLVKTGWGTPPTPIRRQISIARTCYAAGGVILACTQEDFLVFAESEPSLLRRLIPRICTCWPQTSVTDVVRLWGGRVQAGRSSPSVHIVPSLVWSSTSWVTWLDSGTNIAGKTRTLWFLALVFPGVFLKLRIDKF